MSAAAPFTPDGRTRVYGILGHPVSGSLSPAMHNAAFRALDINAVYLPFPVISDQLHQAVAGLVAAGVGGFSLTVPHKEHILPLLEHITPAAEAIGAVNAVRCEERVLHGDNTDGRGFLHALGEDLGYDCTGKQVLLLGAGGSARAIAMTLLEAGVASLHIANRSPQRAEALAADCRRYHLQVHSSSLAEAAGSRPHLLVNTTNVGMGGTETEGNAPVPLAEVGVREAVLDIIYHPLQTPLLAQAKALGLAHANGLGMLLQQGVLAFRFWTDRPAPLKVMRDALYEALAPTGG